MEKKVEEIINNTKNETVHDLLTLFNSKIVENREVSPYKWNYELEFNDITQPDTVPSSALPLVVADKDLLLLTFNGKSIFYDQDLSKVYISIPSITKDMCIYRTENKTYLITLDQSNKLQQSEIKDGVVQQDKFIISRNVLQLVKYNDIVYFISFKKDMYNLNILHVDDCVIRPKIIIAQVQVKYSIEAFPTQFGMFLKKDMKIFQEDGKRFCMEGDGAIDIDKYIVIYKKSEEGMLLSLLNEDMVIKNELTVSYKSQNVFIKTLGPVVVLRAGDHLYFIQVHNKELVIGFEYNYEKYPVSVDFKLQDDHLIQLYNLYGNETTIAPKENYELKGNLVEEDLPQPSETSRTYNPALANPNKTQELDAIVESLFKKFEERIEERAVNETKRQNELLDKISEQLNSSLVKIVQKVIRNEIELLQKKILITVDNRFIENEKHRPVDEAKVLQFTRDIICDTLLPVVESSMDEMRIQVLNEVKHINNLEHLQDIRKYLSNLSLSNAPMSEISSLLMRNRIEDCIIKVIEGGDLEVEEFIRLCDVSYLTDINSSLLLGLLEKLVIYSTDMSTKRDEIIKTILTDIEPNSLSDDELISFQVVLSQIKDSDLIDNPDNDNILFLCCYFIKQIPKILNKRGKK